MAAWFLAEQGRGPATILPELPRDEAPVLADIEQAIRDVTAQTTRDDADIPDLVGRLERLKGKARRRSARRYGRVSSLDLD